MSDENQNSDKPTTYRYFNKNNGDVVERDQKVAKLEMYQNWVRVTDDDHLAELQKDNERNGRGNLLGSASIGDRIEPRHQVPPTTFEPEVDYTRPSKTELPKDRLDPEEFRKDEQPYVVTVDPSKQTQPIAGEGKRDLKAVVLDENLDMNPVSKPIGAGAEDGVLSRAHPELEGVEERRQAMIQEQQASQETGDADAGHTAVRGRPADPDENSTDGKGNTTGQEPDPSNRPSRSATKDAWISWAVECGADRTEAANMTKQDLIEVYGD